MNTAIALGPDAPTKLERPDWREELAELAATAAGATAPKTVPISTDKGTREIADAALQDLEPKWKGWNTGVCAG
ncbi:hypothetical protein SCLCIDRAFT_1214961 [Scleroderma citrinum Foug A]|uniref:Uncharacterized protein n=1 Tax=Scleroderma citrinum Foug A TaxID=1036808 RepID=A0A0C3E3Q7_9AGAM|nr:hypothetical protein SCLCIDRAFT_1214961 [Scleroderma citrinum Foug A]